MQGSFNTGGVGKERIHGKPAMGKVAVTAKAV